MLSAAEQLGMDKDFVLGVKEGLDLLYERRYRDTRSYFAKLEAKNPGTAVSAVGDLLVWQAMMLENFDYRFDDQYRAASKLARAKLGAAGKEPGNEGWEELMWSVVTGLEAIHAARQAKYLPALTLAFEAIDHVESTRKSAPDFVDIRLADGLYNYWRSVLTQRSKALPDFGDRKQEGIAQIQDVIDHGVFLVAPARLSMAFTLDRRTQVRQGGSRAVGQPHPLPVQPDQRADVGLELPVPTKVRSGPGAVRSGAGDRSECPSGALLQGPVLVPLWQARSR